MPAKKKTDNKDIKVDMSKKENIKTLEEIKTDLKEYIHDEIDIEVEKSVNKSEKKLLKHKNIVIFKRDILIVILIICYIVLCYNLYNTHYFDRFFNKQIQNNNSESTKSESESAKETLDELKLKYGNLIDNVVLLDNSKYLSNFYSNNLDNKTKESIALNNISNKINCDESCVIMVNDLEDSFNRLFNIKLEPETFDYDGVTFYYIKSQNMFVSTSKKENITSSIKREIIDITLENDTVSISTVEAIYKDDKILNVTSGKVISTQSDNIKLSKFKDKLNIVKYNFEKNSNGDYYLSSIGDN